MAVMPPIHSNRVGTGFIPPTLTCTESGRFAGSPGGPAFIGCLAAPGLAVVLELEHATNVDREDSSSVVGHRDLLGGAHGTRNRMTRLPPAVERMTRFMAMSMRS